MRAGDNQCAGCDGQPVGADDRTASLEHRRAPTGGIDWRAQTAKILQQKMNKPLTGLLESGLADYVLDDRPDSPDDRLRLLAHCGILWNTGPIWRVQRALGPVSGGPGGAGATRADRLGVRHSNIAYVPPGDAKAWSAWFRPNTLLVVQRLVEPRLLKRRQAGAIVEGQQWTENRPPTELVKLPAAGVAFVDAERKG